MTQTATITLVPMTCSGCGTVFGLNEQFRDKRYEDGQGFYCPNGHRLSWSETETDRQRKRAERAEREAAYQRDLAARRQTHVEAVSRSLASTKGVVTRLNRRVAKGKCPCCRSHVPDLAEHMALNHPDYADSPEASHAD